MYPNESGLTESKPYRDGIIEIYREKPLEISGGFKADTLITDKGEHKFDCVFILRDSIAPDKMVPGLKLKDGHVDVSADEYKPCRLLCLRRYNRQTISVYKSSRAGKCRSPFSNRLFK